MSLPSRSTNTSTSSITIVGGGLAGLTAAISCAEGGANVFLLEAHSAVGGRARSSEGRYKANFGPHVLYKDGPLWRWLADRKLLPRYAGMPLAGVKCRWQGEFRRTPPLSVLPPYCGCAAARHRLSWTFAPGRLSTPTNARRRCCRRRQACTPSITTPVSCRRHLCGSVR